MTNYESHRDLSDRPVVGGGESNGATTQFDVVVVGTGAAAHAAAVMAARGGAEVVMLEVADKIGGTSWRSSGGYWVPNNRSQRERGVRMERDTTLKHMAFLSYPDHFDPDDERLGLPQREYDLIAQYFDLAPKVIDELDAEGILGSTQMDYPDRPDGMPHYYDTGYDATNGTVLGARVDEFSAEHASNPSAEAMRKLGGRQGDGADLVRSLAAAAERLGVQVRLEHRVDGLVVADDDGAVVGVTAQTPNGPVTLGARRGVVFATGGFSHAPQLARQYLRGPIVGSCSVGTARGDFIRIALDAGAELGNMGEAWWTELPVELVKAMSETPELMGFIPGASSIIVNASGRRVVNEKTMYNERGKVHFERAEDGSYPNRVLFLVYDDAVAQDPLEWPSRWPIPPAGVDEPYVIKGATLEELAENVGARLRELREVDGFTLRPEFLDGLKATLERYNGFAEAGVDEDFGRGNVSNQQYSEPARPGAKNNTMAPFRDEGPYYAMILGAATLDTKGGPKIDTEARVLKPGGDPIPGLYGAGNCIASPAGAAYWGGGSTLGPALIYGYVAGRNVAREPVRSSAVQATA